MNVSAADRFLRVVTAAAMLVAVVAPSRAEDLTFNGNGTVRILASDWADYLGFSSSTFLSANAGGRLFYRSGYNAGDGNYIHFDLARLQGLTMQSNASVTLQNTDAQYGGGVDGSFIATANGAWTAAGGAAVPGATAIGDAVNATGSYGSGTSISWGIGTSTFQGYVNSAASFNGLAVIGGSGSQMHFSDPMSPYLSVATNATMNGVVTVSGGGAWNSSNYSFTDGVLTINDAVAGGQSGAGAVTINSLGTVFVNGNYNKYWAIDSTRINAGGVLLGYGHSHLHNLTLAGGELAGIRPDGTYGTWVFDDATTVTGSVTSTISAQQVIFSNGTVNIDAGSTLNFTGSIKGGNAIAPTIAAGGKFINGAAAETSIALGAMALNGGELAATSSPNATLGNYVLYGDVTVGGSTMSTISADVRVINGDNRIFNVADVDSGSGVDLLISGKLGHYNGVSGGSFTKTGAGTMKISGVTEVYSGAVNDGKLILENVAIEGWWGGGLANNAALEYGVTTGSRTVNYSITGSGSVVKTGTGTLVLTAESSYTGGTIVNAGVLSVAGSAGRGRISGALTVNSNGTVQVTGDGSGLGFYDQITSVAINGGVITSAGTQHIWNITGGITMTGGTLQSNDGVSDPNGPQLEWNRTSVTTLASVDSAVIGGRIRMRPDNGYTGISFNVADGAAAADLLVSAAVTESSGGMGITKSGAGTMVLSGANSYTGGTTITGGVLRAGSSTALGAAGSAVTVSAGAGLDVNNQLLAYNPTISGQVNSTTGAVFTTGDLYNSGPAAITLGGNASVGNDGGRFDIGRTSGYSSQGNGYVLTKVGNNTIAVQASGSGFAGVVINGGLVQMENTAAFGNAPFTINNGGALSTWYGLTLANQLTINSGGVVRQAYGWSDTYSGAVTLGGAAVVDASSGSITFSGVMSGSGSLSKTGAATVTLSGANTYSGDTTLSGGGVTRFATVGQQAVQGPVVMAGAGFLVMDQPNQFGAASTVSFTAGSYAEMALYGHDQTIAGLSGNNYAVIQNAHAGLGPASANSTLTINQSFDSYYSGWIRDNTGNGLDPYKLSLVKTGSGTLGLDGTNYGYSGSTTVNGGTIEYYNVAAANSTSKITVNDGGHLFFNANTTSGTVNAPLELNGSSGGATVRANVGGGQLTFTGPVTLLGDSRIEATAANSTVNFTNAIGGTGNLTFAGGGKQVLSGANTYSGTTTVSAGSLAVNGSLASSVVTVAAGAKLQGNGTLAGAVNVQGTLSPGNSPGVITLGSLVLGGSSTTLIEINGTGRGVSYDGVNVTGSSNSLTYGGLLSFNFGSLSPDFVTYHIFDFTGGFSGAFTTVSSTGAYVGTWTDIGGGQFQLLSGPQTLTFTQSTGDVVVVPEPAAIGMAAIGMVLAGRWLARRRSAV